VRFAYDGGSQTGYAFSDLDVICHKANSRNTGMVIIRNSPKKNATSSHHGKLVPNVIKLFIVKAMAKDNPKANSVHIKAIACFVFIEISTNFTSSSVNCLRCFSFSIASTAVYLNKHL
jgi:hypothetical protein